MTQDPNQPPPPQDPPQDPPVTDPPDPGSDPAGLTKELTATRRELAALRKKNQEYEEVARKAQEATLSETEKLQRRVSELEAEKSRWEQERQTVRVKAATESTAARLGFADPEDAHRFLDLAALEFDDKGAPKNLEAQLKDVLKAKPYLGKAGAGSGDPGNRNAPANGTDMNAVIRRAAGRPS